MSLSARLALAGFLLVPPSITRGDHRKVTDLYRPGEERVWIFEQDGKRIAYHTFRYEGTVDSLGAAVHRFTGRVQVDAMPAMGLPQQRYQCELFTDDSGLPLRQVLEAELGQSYSRVELSIARGKADAVIVQGRAPKNVTIDVPEKTYLQANNFVGYLELLLALLPPGEDGAIEGNMLSSNAVKVLPYRAHRQGPLEKTAGSEVAGAKLEDSLGEVISLSDDGRVLLIEIPAQKIKITRSDEHPEPFTIHRPPATPAGPHLDVEQVEIKHGEVRLAGEISRAPGAKGRLPAVFFISGSGLQDRDGFSSGIDLGTHEILDRLTQEGFLVLRVDDRGTGGSQGPLENLNLDDLIADARACVDFLLARDDVDPDRVVLIGHSEGGITAPILAVERPRIAALVLMAATARPVADVILEQNGLALDLAGVQGDDRKKILEDVRKYLDLAASDKAIKPEEIPADYRSVLSMRAWLKSHAKQDPRANIQKVRCPVLVLQGEKDFQVSPDRDAREIAKALDEVRHADHELVVLPGLDHLFKKVAGEKSHMSDYFERRPVDAGFLDALVAWLGKRLHAEKPH